MITTNNFRQLNRINDIFFKYLLGSEERKNYTLNFLNTTLDLSGKDMFTDLFFADKEKMPQMADGKLSILDILAITNSGTRVNIEIQVCKDRYMAQRALYYWAKVYGDQLQKKESYDKLNKVISIILMDFEFFEQYKDEFHQLYHIKNDGHPKDILTDHLEMHFIELEKIHYSDIKKLKRSDRWIAYLSKKVNDKDRKELTVMDPVLKDVMDSENAFVSDMQLWREYEAREKAVRDEKSHLLTARLDGIDEGIAKGIALEKVNSEKKLKQKTLDIVRKCLVKGMNVETVADVASIPVSEVLKVQAELDTHEKQ